MKSKRVRIVLAVVVGLLVIGYSGGSWYFSGILVAFPLESLDESRADMEESGIPANPAAYGMPQPEDVRIDAGDGITLAGWYFENELERDCGVILLHGFQGTRVYGFVYAPLFWDRGCDLLMFDARHHGESTGDFGTFGYYEKEDTLAVLHWMSERSGLRTSQIGLMGVSYGAATVLQAAALEPDIAFVAADSSYQDMATIVSEQAVQQYGGWINIMLPGALQFSAWRAQFDPQAVSPLLAAREIKAPIFLIHSQQDEFTLAAHSEAIYANISHDRSVLYITDWGAAHARSIRVDFDAFKSYVDDFLELYVPQFGS